MSAHPLVTRLPEFAFSLFPESPEAWAGAGTCQCPWPGLDEPALNDTQHHTRALLMSQAGRLYSFCPSTQEVTGAARSSSPAFPLLSSPPSVHNRSPSLPSSRQLATVADLLAAADGVPSGAGLCSPTQQPARLAGLRLVQRERRVCLPTARFGSPPRPLLPLSSHVCRDAGVNKSQTLTPPPPSLEKK